MSLHITPYEKKYSESLLSLFDLNCPKYFAPSEKKDFEHYLEFEIEYYFVWNNEDNCVGCGGINLKDDAFYLSWDLIHPDEQGKGLGTELIHHRLRFIHNLRENPKIRVRTSQYAAPFYAKNGFREMKYVAHYWAPRFDLVEMEFIP